MDSGVEKTRILPKEYDIRTDTRDTLARVPNTPTNVIL